MKKCIIFLLLLVLPVCAQTNVPISQLPFLPNFNENYVIPVANPGVGTYRITLQQSAYYSAQLNNSYITIYPTISNTAIQFNYALANNFIVIYTNSVYTNTILYSFEGVPQSTNTLISTTVAIYNQTTNNLNFVWTNTINGYSLLATNLSSSNNVVQTFILPN